MFAHVTLHHLNLLVQLLDLLSLVSFQLRCEENVGGTVREQHAMSIQRLVAISTGYFTDSSGQHGQPSSDVCHKNERPPITSGHRNPERITTGKPQATGVVLEKGWGMLSTNKYRQFDKQKRGRN